MRAYKVKIEKSVFNKKTLISYPMLVGFLARIQAIYYNSTNPARYLHLYDAEGDEFMFPIPGQQEPKVTTPEIPVLVKLPLSYLDEGEGHQIIIWGEMIKET